jgi:hypothetical protein
VYLAQAKGKTQNKFVRSQGIRTGGAKERGARWTHKRLLHYVNVNRTSPDHLLLGRNADIDKDVECPDYSAGIGEMSAEAFP